MFSSIFKNIPYLLRNLNFDFERSDDCIDFTMLCMCVFFVFVYARTCRYNAWIFNFSSFSDSKVNLIGALGRSFFEFPDSFLKHLEKPKKKKN
ncbi:Uncharacterized protein FWK35_00001940 [Aphis craccivora]|uniref:Uncharacterized protein n=1 Tax=Aphis craccivora TaxID=307492 RepID=A0A6G0Z8Z1_APHCR|nr:Uncharacterized protein FWK35_00001940 [Aphis craccivora]